MQELIPEFQKASGHTVKVTYGNLGINADRTRKGEADDLTMVSPQQWDSLQKKSKIDASVRVIVGRVGIGGFVKKGAAGKDISSVDALKRTLLGARSIAVGDPSKGSPVGVYLLPLFDRLGIGNEIKSKLRLTAGGPGSFQAVISGDAELGFSQMTEVIAASGVDGIGALPADVQNLTTFVAAVPNGARQAAAAKALIDFLKSPKAVSVFKSKGLEAG
jgi:molybdate transport system substrate-binding protein